MRSAIADGARLQVLTQGCSLVAFVGVAPWLIPAIFGDHWLPIMVVLPYVGGGALVHGLFTTEISALYVLRLNTSVLGLNLLHVVLFAAATLAGLRLEGLAGYGWGEVAALSSYPLLHAVLSRRIGSPQMGVATAWTIGCACAVFIHVVGWWMILPLAAVLAWPRTWGELRPLAEQLRRGGRLPGTASIGTQTAEANVRAPESDGEG
jgi:PST family polysaccharide transporter